jgi:hypothetical protein
MEKLCSELTAVVVGTKKQSIIREIIVLLNRINIPFKVCEDIYSAAATLATASSGTNLLVVGCLTALTAENMRLFAVEPEGRQVWFCCMMEKWHEHLHNRFMAAAKAGAYVINNVRQLENVITQCRGSDLARSSLPEKANGRDFATRIASLADSFFLTQAERSALLGVDGDGNSENFFSE